MSRHFAPPGRRFRGPFPRATHPRNRFDKRPRPAIFPEQMNIEEKQAALIEELDLFQDWQERYEYVIGLGKKLPPMPEEAKTPEKLIKGCQSQVWLDASLENGRVRYRADSDSLITKGLIAIFIRVLDDETPEAILSADMSFIDRTGLKEHLAPTRANALSLMATQMKQRALEFATKA